MMVVSAIYALDVITLIILFGVFMREVIDE